MSRSVYYALILVRDYRDGSRAFARYSDHKKDWLKARVRYNQEMKRLEIQDISLVLREYDDNGQTAEDLTLWRGKRFHGKGKQNG